jgi:hypothetical protein
MARGYSIKLPFTIPPRLDENTYLESVDAYLEGDETQRDRLILGHMSLSVSTASLFTGFCPRKEDDFVEVGFITLVDAVIRFPSIARDNNLTAYIRVRLNWAMRTELVGGNPVKGKTMDQHREVCFTDLASERWKHDVTDLKVPNLPLEVREICDLSVEDEVEKRILHFLLLGYTNKETAAELKVSERFTSVRRNKILAKIGTFYEE